MHYIHRQVAAAAITVCCLAAPMAHAQEAPAIPITLAPATDGSFAAAVTRDVSALFVDSFNVAAPAGLLGSATVTFTTVAGPVTFFAAQLGEQSFSAGEGGSTFSFQAALTPGLNALTVLGFAGDPELLSDGSGRYRLDIAAAIPEPETYALMLGGLALLAAVVMRRRAHA